MRPSVKKNAKCNKNNWLNDNKVSKPDPVFRQNPPKGRRPTTYPQHTPTYPQPNQPSHPNHSPQTTKNQPLNDLGDALWGNGKRRALKGCGAWPNQREPEVGFGREGLPPPLPCLPFIDPACRLLELRPEQLEVAGHDVLEPAFCL